MSELTVDVGLMPTTVFAHGFADRPDGGTVARTSTYLPNGCAVRAPSLGFAAEGPMDGVDICMPYPLDVQTAILEHAIGEVEGPAVLVSHSQGTYATLAALATSNNKIRHAVLTAPIVDPRREYQRILRAEQIQCLDGDDFKHVQDHLLSHADQHPEDGISRELVLTGLRAIWPFYSYGHGMSAPQLRRYAVITEPYMDSLRTAAEYSEQHIERIASAIGDVATVVLADFEKVTDAVPEVFELHMPGSLRMDGAEPNCYILPTDHNMRGSYEQLAEIINQRIPMTN